MTAIMATPMAKAVAKAARLAAAAGMATILASCVQVSAPDDPIVVNLNINIRQEVVVRLQQDARELIERERRDY
jgi:hypothetical protein